MDFSGRIIVLAEISNKQLSSLKNSLTGLEFENRDNDTINYCEHLLRTFLILNDPQRPFLISDPRNIVCNKKLQSNFLPTFNGLFFIACVKLTIRTRPLSFV